MESKVSAAPAEPGLSLAIAAAETVQLAELKRDPDLQCRAKGINKRTVAEYAASMAGGAVFPAVTVFRDKRGVLLLADGWHRVGAAELAGLAELPADIREGGRREALLHAAQANGQHGLRRTLADRRAAVQRVLAAYPTWSDRRIGEACNVDHKTAGAVRKAQELAKRGGEFPTPADGADNVPRSVEPALADLAPIYLRVLSAHATREPAEHIAAMVRAIVELHAGTTPVQLVAWVQSATTEPEPAPLARVTPRRRIVQPAGSVPVAVNGAE